MLLQTETHAGPQGSRVEMLGTLAGLLHAGFFPMGPPVWALRSFKGL